MSKRKKERVRVPIMRLAAKNVSVNSWMNFKLCFVFACLAFLICLFTGYNTALADRRQQMLDGAVSMNYAYTSSTLNGSLSSNLDQRAKELFEGKNGTLFVRSALARRVNTANHLNLTACTSEYLRVSIGGETVEPADEDFSISAYSSAFPTTDDDRAELLYRYGFDEPIVGRRPEANDEIVLSENFLKNYGMTIDDIGTRITITLVGENAPYFEGTVVGVYRHEYYELTGHSDWSTQLLPIFLLAESHPAFKTNIYRTKLYLTGFITDHNFIEDLRLTKNFMYAGAKLVTTVRMLDNIVTLANTLYVIIGSSLGFGLVLTVFLMVGKYVNVFARSSGILLTLGMSRGRLYRLLLCQLFYLALLSIPMAAVLTCVGYFVVRAVMLLVTNVAMEISFGKLAGLLLAGIVIVFAVALLFYAYTLFRIRKKSVKELLQTEVR